VAPEGAYGPAVADSLRALGRPDCAPEVGAR